MTLAALALPAEAGVTNPPYNSGNNAAGYGYGYNSSTFHDIDRKHCNWTGCSYLDGSNVYYNSSGYGTAYRGKQCGTHRYRHQSSTGDSANRELSRSC